MASLRRPSSQMKSRFRLAKKANPKLRMKAWARQLAEEGDQVALAWLFNKSSQVNKEAKELRWKNKGHIITLNRAATKAAKRRRSLKRQGKDPSKVKAPTQPVVVSTE
jgi:dienelactone hydrolase